MPESWAITVRANPMTIEQFSRIAGWQAFIWWLGQSQGNRRAWNELALGRYLTEAIRKIRDDRGYTRAELATRSGVSVSTISRLELYLNDAACASLETLHKISAGLSCAIIIDFAWERALNHYRSDLKTPAAFDAGQLMGLARDAGGGTNDG